MSDYRYDLVLQIEGESVYCALEEPSRFLRKSSGKVAFSDDQGIETEIGTFSTIFLDVQSALTEEDSVFDLFDSDSTTINYFEDLYDHGTLNFKPKVTKVAFSNDYSYWNPNLLILDRLTVDAEHQGHGVGLLALRALIHRFRAGAGLIAMKPYPLQFEASFLDGKEVGAAARMGLDTFKMSQPKATAKLKKYYSRLGFKPVPRSDYMILSPEHPLPSVASLTKSTR